MPLIINMGARDKNTLKTTIFLDDEINAVVDLFTKGIVFGQNHGT